VTLDDAYDSQAEVVADVDVVVCSVVAVVAVVSSGCYVAVDVVEIDNSLRMKDRRAERV
jgi:hypothetical protein